MFDTGNIPTAYHYLAFIRPDFGNQKPGNGSFARTGLADDGNKLAWFNMQVDIFKSHGFGLKSFGYIYQMDHRWQMAYSLWLIVTVIANLPAGRQGSKADEAI